MNKIIVSALFLVLSIELSKSFPKTYLVETETGKSIHESVDIKCPSVRLAQYAKLSPWRMAYLPRGQRPIFSDFALFCYFPHVDFACNIENLNLL